MQLKPTNELDQILKETGPEAIGDYLRENRPYMADAKKAFSYYMKDVYEEKGIRLKEVYVYAGVSESYGSKILSMEKHTTNRDLILRFCLAGHMSLGEMNRALKLYGMNELYARDPRDACIIVAVNHRIFDLLSINDLLKKEGLAPVFPEE